MKVETKKAISINLSLYPREAKQLKIVLNLFASDHQVDSDEDYHRLCTKLRDALGIELDDL